jgi:RNA polymerase sigma-70 factor (ECF subfamily)
VRTRELEALTDEDLLRAARAQSGDPTEARAASILLERYQDRVYVWCFRLVRDHDRALDLAQDVLVSAYRGLGTFEARSGFASWLFVIARNRCLSVLRRPSPIWEDDGALDEIADPSPGPDEELEKKLDEETVLESICLHLDPLEREALWLRCYEGMPVDEITRLLRIEAATGARSVIQRARRKLRAALDRPRTAAPTQGGSKRS